MTDSGPPSAPRPADPTKPVVMIPVTAADMERRKRRNVLISIALLAVMLAAGWVIYRRISDPLAARQAFDAGRRLLLATRYEEAILNFSRTIDLEPDSAEAYRLRARAYVALTKPDQAIPDFTRVSQLRPNDPTAFVERGFAYLDKRDYQGAIADATRAISLDPRQARAFNLRANAIRASAGPQQALSDFSRAVELDPNLDNYFQRASTFQMLNQHALAVADFDHAMDLDPAQPHIYFARAESRAALGDVRGAREDIQTGRKIDGW